MTVPTLADIQAAHAAIQDRIRDTPMKRSAHLSRLTGGDIHLKLECFQRTGSFKVRGALWKVANLSAQERAAGVVAASAGNHAQGVAFAATAAGVASDVFMPEGATLAKAKATAAYGATIHLVGSDYQEAYEAAVAFQQEHGKAFVHAFDDPFIMAGQGTMGLEILRDLPELDTLVIPVGGGGLIGGVATAAKALRPELRVIAVQAAGASTVAPSLEKGAVVPLDAAHTMADGIACRHLGTHTFEAIQQSVDEVVTVEENEIAAAILYLLERTKVAAEGAGAVTLAAALHGKIDLTGQQTCLVVSGGNIDMSLMSRIIQRGLVASGRTATLAVSVPDKPGEIARLLQLLAAHKGNVLDISHDRLGHGVPLHRTHVEVHLETRGPEHIDELVATLAAAGYDDAAICD